jgi:hypothetical protein
LLRPRLNENASWDSRECQPKAKVGGVEKLDETLRGITTSDPDSALVIIEALSVSDDVKAKETATIYVQYLFPQLREQVADLLVSLLGDPHPDIARQALHTIDVLAVSDQHILPSAAQERPPSERYETSTGRRSRLANVGLGSLARLHYGRPGHQGAAAVASGHLALDSCGWHPFYQGTTLISLTVRCDPSRHRSPTAEAGQPAHRNRQR